MTSGVITLHRQGDFGKGKTLGKRPLILPAKVARAFTESARQAVPVAREKIILAALAVFSPDKPCSIQARDRKACKKSNSGIYRTHVEQKTEHHGTGRKKVAAFTGHRKQRLMQENKDYRNLSGQIRGKVITMIKNLYEEGFREFYSGMAEGFDMIAAEAVLQLKEQYEDMTLAAAIPFRAQAEWFDPQDQLLYRELLKKADRVVMLSEKYYRGCYLRRDTYMVSRASMVIAYWDNVCNGGTYHTVKKAVETGREVINLFTGEVITDITALQNNHEPNKPNIKWTD